ncbi:MAG: hypothetical protein LQ352_005810 [Teloschistes flavicans]|nr:MAG: hypothetical protein LQ352_005810 [Teloschistes flavicans]
MGISLGLSRIGKDNANKTAKPSSTSGTPAQPKPSSTSGTPARPSVILQHRLLSNTPLTAITTVPNNDRHLYFQEKSGAFRRAVYSAQAKTWQTAVDDTHLPPGSKNDTPLAGVSGFLNNSPDQDALIYVNSTNQLSCVDWWGQRDSSSCTVNLPETFVAAGSRAISATTIAFNQDLRGLLLFYKDAISRKPSMMLGFVNISYPQSSMRYTWQNETETLISAMGYYPGAVATACIAGGNVQHSAFPYFIDCFVNSTLQSGLTAVQFNLNLTSSYGLAITPESSYNHDLRFVEDSDVAPLAQGGRLFLKHSTHQHGFDPIVYGQTTLPPTSQFPFNRLASIYAINSNSTYLYHQLSDTIIAEELWDGISGVWISKNITIDTSI